MATKTGASLQIGRASNGGLPKRDVNTAVNLTAKFHQDSEGNDEKRWDLMQRLQKMMPAHIKPAFKTVKNYWPGRKNKGRSAPPLST